MTICLFANTLTYPYGGGHRWVSLNWALGFRALGCRVIWLEGVGQGMPGAMVRWWVSELKKHLEPYGLAEWVAICSGWSEQVPLEGAEGCLDLDAALEADLMVNLQYTLSPLLVRRFRRSALLDIDPGLLQGWLSLGKIEVARHDMYFTIGETVGRPGSLIPDVGLEWEHTPPCVALEYWPAQPAAADAPFTTISNWHCDEWMEDEKGVYPNDKRTGFLPFLDLPRLTDQPLELALCLGHDEDDDRIMLQERGWRMRDAMAVAPTPWEYQAYIQASRGEFSCVKPSCIRMQNAWISDRTLCYLASGKPAVVQHTGPSRFLPEDAGLFRFRDPEEAVRCLERLAADYERQCRLARALAEEYFDARKVAASVLERALP
jgi:hypothetical protein